MVEIGTATGRSGDSVSEMTPTVIDYPLTDSPPFINRPPMESVVTTSTTQSKEDEEDRRHPRKRTMLEVNTSASTVLRYNFMVAGPSGAGKSTFCNALLRRYFPGLDLTRPDGPTKVIEQRGRVEKMQGKTRIILTVTDTRGSGESMNNGDCIAEIEDFIVAQNAKYEAGEGYRHPNQQENDTRIHICFYFLAPHRVTPLDCEIMSRLQPKVAIVPIVAKADTMTIAELKVHLRLMRKCLEEKSIDIFDFGETPAVDASWVDEPSGDGTDAFVRVADTLLRGGEAGGGTAAAAARATPLPRIPNVFALISGDREYMWGTASENDPSHSDALRLHNVLFRDGSLGKLQQRADDIHERWRSDAEEDRRKRREEEERLAEDEERRARAAKRARTVRRLKVGAMTFVSFALAFYLLKYVPESRRLLAQEPPEEDARTCAGEQDEIISRHLFAVEKCEGEVSKLAAELKAASEPALATAICILLMFFLMGLTMISNMELFMVGAVLPAGYLVFVSAVIIRKSFSG